MTKILVETCAASFESAQAAVLAGADRIELNLALELDGLTPSSGLLRRVTSELQVPVIAMARPRAGDFVYSVHEWATILADADYLVNHGAAGVAFGCLNSQGEVEIDRCRQIRGIIGDRELVFHKAFDVTCDWKSAMDALVEVGVNRIMTSGQQTTAFEGRSEIAAMLEYANGRIEVLPAGGVNSSNANQIVNETKCSQVHGSFSVGANGAIIAEIERVIASLAAL